ncbi:MAG: pyridoxal 5'-phosphate synthase glutaminase subunit PdxT [Chloroflexi bacterium]|nr:pyridoxal 5'-phosphate synthase glutaminase subunit PdxT [Chloroflexota bacterium]
MKIGVLALQGDFIEHVHILASIGAEAVEVRLPAELDGLQGLIIPGGESTTFGKLADEFGLIEPLRDFCKSGKPVWGTCAGMIFLARDVGRAQPVLGLMDVRVKRNAFGRQVDSFEQELDVPALAVVEDGRENAAGAGQAAGPASASRQGRATVAPFHAIFIRAPMIESVGEGVRVLAALDDGTIVAAQQQNLLATSFHPELAKDTRFHRYFMEHLGRVQ